jgi:hypothetical protein
LAEHEEETGDLTIGRKVKALFLNRNEAEVPFFERAPIIDFCPIPTRPSQVRSGLGWVKGCVDAFRVQGLGKIADEMSLAEYRLRRFVGFGHLLPLILIRP